jgi:hypothetical protein
MGSRMSFLQGMVLSLAQDDSDTMSEILSSWYGKALLPRFADSSEAVRELAVSSFLVCIRSSNTALPLLPYIIPVLEERIDSEKIGNKEASEDIRLKLMQVWCNEFD